MNIKRLLSLLVLVLCLSGCAGFFSKVHSNPLTDTIFTTMARIVNIADNSLKTAYAIRGPAIRASAGFRAAALSGGVPGALAFYDDQIAKYDQARVAVTKARTGLEAAAKIIDDTDKPEPVEEAVIQAIDVVVATTQSVKSLAGANIPQEMDITLGAVCLTVKSLTTKPTKCAALEPAQPLSR